MRYVLEGSLQMGARRARVNVQLISANDGIHLWADRFDKEIGDVLDLQDEIAERMSRAIAVQLRDAEIKRGTGTTKSSLDAATLVQLGRRTFTQGVCRRNTMRAAEIYAEAVRVDENNALAHALLSICKLSSFSSTCGAMRQMLNLRRLLDTVIVPGRWTTAYRSPR